MSSENRYFRTIDQNSNLWHTLNMNNALYQVIDMLSGDIVSTHTSRKAAQRKADRLDLEYGAIMYRVVEVKHAN